MPHRTNLRQLAHFVAVAEEGSFTRAAQRSNIVQSGISASIAALERQFGVTLFHRTKHRAELTPAGSALLVEARRALAAVVAGRAAAQAAQAAVSGSLRIGVGRATPKRIQLPRLVREFKNANPEIALYLRETASVDVADLRSGKLDLIIGPAPVGDPGVTSISLASSPIVLAVADSHPLASSTSVHLAAIAGEQFIDLPPGWTTRRIADRALADAGIERRSTLEVGNIDFALMLIAERAGISLLPELVSDYANGVTFVTLEPPVSAWEFFVSFLGDEPPTPAARSFLMLLRSGLAERGTDRRER